jgi:hypothetical protein
MAIVLKIFIEGGVLPNANINAQTINNSERLRESFYKLLSKKVDPSMFTLEVNVNAGISNVIKTFKSELEKGSDNLLFIDLDKPKEYRNERLEELGLEELSSEVIFMVQEMEAWILSQPDKIEECFAGLKRIRNNELIADDNNLKDKHPEIIKNPSRVMQTILGRYFRIEKRGIVKKKKYGKLKDAPQMLEMLDWNGLETTFEDVKKFSDKFLD